MSKEERSSGARSRSRRSEGDADSFTAEERAAIRDRAREARGGGRAGSRGSKTDGEAALLEKIAEMPDADRRMAERILAIVKASAPDLAPKTWYGMPAWARDGKVVCFFQGAAKFKTRYATLGFTDEAKLDEGPMWATSFALESLSPAEESRIGELVRRAVG
jgi:uncharacterized protein YdhG (YjbR/CyaY superfamily)